MSENFFDSLHLYTLPFGIFMIFISLRKGSKKGILFFIPIVISGFLLLGTLETKNEIKEEKKEFYEKLTSIKSGMSSQEIEEFEKIINYLTMKDKKEFVNKIYKQKFEKNLKKYKEVDFKE